MQVDNLGIQNPRQNKGPRGITTKICCRIEVMIYRYLNFKDLFSGSQPGLRF